jgi:hypothetical protein
MTVVDAEFDRIFQRQPYFWLRKPAARRKFVRSERLRSPGIAPHALSEPRNELDIHYEKIVVLKFPEYIFTFSNLWDKAKCALNGSLTDVVVGESDA